MAKTFREFVAEVAQPISQGEINFLKKHVTVLIDYPIDVEDQFTGGDVHKFTRLADYKPGQDVAVYEGEMKLDGDEEINKAESERHKKLETLRKIIDESIDAKDDLSEEQIIECLEVLSELSEDNIEYAIENNVNLIDFAMKFVD